MMYLRVLKICLILLLCLNNAFAEELDFIAKPTPLSEEMRVKYQNFKMLLSKKTDIAFDNILYFTDLVEYDEDFLINLGILIVENCRVSKTQEVYLIAFIILYDAIYRDDSETINFTVDQYNSIINEINKLNSSNSKNSYIKNIENNSVAENLREKALNMQLSINKMLKRREMLVENLLIAADQESKADFKSAFVPTIIKNNL